MATTDLTVEDLGSGLVLPAPAAAAPRPVELAEALVEQARVEGVELVGPGGGAG